MNEGRRNYSVDSLRVILIFMIIIHHLLLRGEGVRLLESGMYNGEWIYPVLNVLTVSAVNVFFLISGYFRIKFKFDKIIKMIISVYVIYYFINIIFLYVGEMELTNDVLKGFAFPISKYWFIFVYIILSFLSIWINKLIEVINGKEIFTLCCVLFFVFCFYGFFVDNLVIGVNNGYSLNYAIFMYFIGACIEKNKDIISLKKYIGVIMCGCIMLNMFIVWSLIVSNKYLYVWHMYSYNNPLVLGYSICLFVIFLKRKISLLDCYIARLSRYVLYVYIFHSTKSMFDWIVDSFLVYKNSNYLSSIILIVIFSLIVFLIGSFMGWIYSVMYNAVSKLKSKILKYN